MNPLGGMRVHLLMVRKRDNLPFTTLKMEQGTKDHTLMGIVRDMELFTTKKDR